MFQIVVASGKGGVGKSLIASSLIKVLGSCMKVVGMDGDAPTPNLHIPFGIDTWDEEREYSGGRTARIDPGICTHCMACTSHCPYEAIDLRDGCPEVIGILCEGCGVCSLVCPVDAIAFSVGSSGRMRRKDMRPETPLISARLDVGRPNSGKLVSGERAWTRDVGASHGSDLLVIDGAAGIGCSVMASVTGCDLALLVAEPTPASLSDVSRMLKVAAHFRVPSYIVINKSDINEGFDGLEDLCRREGIGVMERIPYDPDVPRSFAAGRPFVEMYPSNVAAERLRSLADKVRAIFEGQGVIS